MRDDVAKHTPGPWEAQRSPRLHDGAYDFAISAPGFPIIAEAFGRTSDGRWPAVEANARLIAAAPEMLAALRGAEALITNDVTRDFGATLAANPMPGSVLANIRAALAKAAA